MVDINQIQLEPILDTLQLLKIEDEEYFHNEKYKSRISNSRLGLLKSKGPQAFLDGFAAQSGFNPSFKLGSMVHSQILEPEYFEICDTVDLPTAKLGGMAEYLYPYWLNGTLNKDIYIEASNKIEYYKDRFTSAMLDYVRENSTTYWESRKAFEESYTGWKTVWFTDPATRAKAHGCINAIQNNNQMMNILHPTDLFGNPIISECEWAILLDAKVIMPDTEPFIVHLKAKLDNFVIDKDNNRIQINDIKTTFKKTTEFEGVIDQYSYSRELAFYAILLSLVAKKFYNMDNPEVTGNFLVVCTMDPYYTRVVPMTNELFKRGLIEFKELIRQGSYYLNYGVE